LLIHGVRSFVVLAAELPGHLDISAPSVASTNPLDTQRMQTSRIRQIPALSPSSLSHLCARYLQVQFRNKLNGRSSGAFVSPPAQPLMLPVALASELDIIATVLVDAFSNRSQWDEP
jgi:hypothetical protein